MNKRIDVEKLHTISDCLQALSDITLIIDDIKMQLDYGSGDDAWRSRANMALRKCKRVCKSIQGKLSILRQEEKELNIKLNSRRNDFLVKELIPHVSPEVLISCSSCADQRATQSIIDDFVDQVCHQEKPMVYLPPPFLLWGIMGREMFHAHDLIPYIEKQGYVVEVGK